ncbi:hypothetical protein [Modestobacter sp. URMC 112]
MRVLVAARDLRVRRALSRLLELHGDLVVGATDAGPGLLPDLDDQLGPDLVVLELDRRAQPQDLRVVSELARRGRPVIAVCSSGSTPCAAVLAAGARACLDEDVHFPDRLAEAVQAVGGSARGAAPPA